MLCEFLAHFAKESKIKRNTKRGRFRFSFLRAPRSTISLLIDRLDKNIDLEELFFQIFIAFEIDDRSFLSEDGKRRSRKFARKSIGAVNEGGNKGGGRRDGDVSAVDTHANSSLSLSAAFAG